MNDLLTREELATLDTLVPELIEPVAPPPALRAQILAAVAGVPQDSVTIRAEEETWRPFPAPGVRWKKLSSNRSRGTLTVLMEIAPGAAVPSHGHHGAEDCFVVAGSCRIGGVSLAQGDFHHVESGARHGTVVSDAGCTLLLVVDSQDWAA
jgi:anti-sigma factor ChrR (cupin superfamily)